MSSSLNCGGCSRSGLGLRICQREGLHASRTNASPCRGPMRTRRAGARSRARSGSGQACRGSGRNFLRRRRSAAASASAAESSAALSFKATKLPWTSRTAGRHCEARTGSSACTSAQSSCLKRPRCRRHSEQNDASFSSCSCAVRRRCHWRCHWRRCRRCRCSYPTPAAPVSSSGPLLALSRITNASVIFLRSFLNSLERLRAS